MSASITVRVYCNAVKNEVTGFIGGAWRTKISAPPVRGKANKELMGFLSEVLVIGKDRVNLARGHTSRTKLIIVEGLAQEEVMKRLSSVSVR